MGVKLYADGDGARYEAKFGVKRAGKVGMRTVRFAVVDSTQALCDSAAWAIAEYIENHSFAKLMSLKKMMGHYIKNEVLVEEPGDSVYALGIKNCAANPRKSGMVYIPHLDSTTLTFTQWRAALLAAPFDKLARVETDVAGTGIETFLLDERKAGRFAAGDAPSDTIVDADNTENDAGADGIVGQGQ